ncbi:chloride channel protein [Salinisphaera sp. Q1T1-3]|uniref:chloride channel protein n=1 Tax=Salinisphaera sp. Q1T1-3 TaxID=2321229 RepID=UPI001314AB29|nr:chloride channel protein [Salinisphaera sp. Q1T1-3]
MARPRAIERSSLVLALMAVAVGIAAGYGAGLFRALIGLFHNIAFSGTFSFAYDANQHTDASVWGAGIILVPMIGAVIVTWLVRTFAPEAKGHGVPEVIDAIYYRGGIIRPSVVATKALASSISIATGGAVGREGPIIQIGSALGSGLGQLVRLREWQRNTLIASGAAAGITATFNAPLGGLLFAIEIILPETSGRTLIPVLLSTGAAAFVGQSLFGDTPSFNIPALGNSGLELSSPTLFVIYVIFGVLLGLAAWLFTRSIYWAEAAFEKLPVNDYVRHVAGMGVVGVMMYAFLVYGGHYYVEGVGYATIQNILENLLTNPWLLLLLFAAKLLATSLTLGSGASGGVFSPALYLGATLGGAFAVAMQHIAPGFHLDVATMAVLGMAGVVAGSTGAALTALVIIFEMTRDYHVIIPMVIIVSIAYGVRQFLMADTIYTFKLTRRNHPVPASLETNLFMLRKAAEFYDPRVVRVGSTRGIAEVRRRFRRFGRQSPNVLVLDKNQQIQAIFSSRRHYRLKKQGGLGIRSWADDHMETDYIVVGAEDMIFDIVGRLRAAACEVALVTPDGTMSHPREVQGVLTLSDVARSSRLARQMERRRSARKPTSRSRDSAVEDADET